MLVLISIALVLLVRGFEKPAQEALFWGGGILAIHLLHLVLPMGTGAAILWTVLILGSRLVWGRWPGWAALGRRLALMLPFLLVASMPTRFIDAGRYYNQMVRWFEQGLLAGLGNFDLYLIQASAGHSLEALGHALLAGGQNEVLPLVAALLLARGMEGLAWRGPDLMTAGLVMGVMTQFAQASSPDLLLVALLLAAGPTPTRSLRVLLMLLFPLIKLYGALYALWLWWPERRKSWAWGALAGAGLLAGLKLIYLAGWLPGIGPLGLPWSITGAAGDFIGKAVGGSEKLNPGHYEGGLGGLRTIETLGIGFFLLLWGLGKLRHPGSWRAYLGDYGSNLLLLLLWLWLFPQVRILLVLCFPLLLMPRKGGTFLKAPFAFRPWPLFLLLGSFSALWPWQSFSLAGQRWQRFTRYSGYTEVRWGTPAPLWQVATRRVDSAGVMPFYVPVGRQYCYDAAFPCRYFEAHSYEDESAPAAWPVVAEWKGIPYLTGRDGG